MTTNPKTRVVISAYQGDLRQVTEMLPLWQHHGCPVTIVSPADSRVDIEGVDCLAAGGRGHFGPEAQARHITHLKMLLDYPEDFFFINESDAFCIDTEFPAYLYADPEKFWTNGGRDESDLDGRLEARPRERWYSFQAPWWMPRRVIERMVEIAPRVQYDPRLKWIDLYLPELAFAAGVPFERFRDAICMPVAPSNYLDHELNAEVQEIYRNGMQIALKSAREGVNMIHSCKSIAAGRMLVEAYENGFKRNNDTLVSVHCYAGDLHQVEGNLPAYLHHKSRVAVVSPTDSVATISHPDVDNIQAGLVGYTGQVSLDRQLLQMQALLTNYPKHKFFLLNDSDSAVLDPVIPAFLYEEDVVWSNMVMDHIPGREPFPDGWPTVAFQPPYFMSRRLLEKMVEAGLSGHPLVKATGSRPFIDFYMVQLTMVAGLPWKPMKDAVSWPISINRVAHPNPDAGTRAVYDHGFQLASNAVRNEGVSIVHSTKDGETTATLVELRRQFKEGHPDWSAKDREIPIVGERVAPILNGRHPAATAAAKIDSDRRQRAALLGQQRARIRRATISSGLKA